MIRRSDDADLDPIMLLWLRSTLAAHPFIDESYWYESASMVRESFYRRPLPGLPVLRAEKR
ncbi:hypothetical protein [Rouxiella chamberiensis]|uniref:hypothetical protein n=1 Tax=Rouxiella chamberiensis TaxID=1513468 RepID=UPI002ED17936